jgi:hypothetical protein
MLYGEVPQSGGFKFTNRHPPKSAVLRLPTSAQMIERINRQKTIRNSIGRGKWQSELVANPEADLKLFAELRIDQEGDAFSAAECRAAILKFTSAEVVSCDRPAEGYKITLRTPFGDVSHTLREPMEDEMFDFGRTNFASTDLRHGREELAWRADASVKLYDAVKLSAEGYAAGYDVPAHHKFAVAGELAQAVAELDPQIELGPNS